MEKSQKQGLLESSLQGYQSINQYSEAIVTPTAEFTAVNAGPSNVFLWLGKFSIRQNATDFQYVNR